MPHHSVLQHDMVHHHSVVHITLHCSTTWCTQLCTQCCTTCSTPLLSSPLLSNFNFQLPTSTSTSNFHLTSPLRSAPLRCPATSYPIQPCSTACCAVSRGRISRMSASAPSPLTPRRTTRTHARARDPCPPDANPAGSAGAPRRRAVLGISEHSQSWVAVVVVVVVVVVVISSSNGSCIMKQLWLWWSLIINVTAAGRRRGARSGPPSRPESHRR